MPLWLTILRVGPFAAWLPPFRLLAIGDAWPPGVAPFTPWQLFGRAI